MNNTGASKLYGLDHLRALAIILVFLYHYRLHIFGHPQWIADYAAFGWTGVDLFFVLSGFLISSQLFAQIKATGAFSLRSFFTRRIFRIMPAYALIVAIYFLVPAFHEREALPPLWRFATFTQNLWLDLGVHGTFSHAWSLCVEEHFYLLLPLLLSGLLRFRLFRASAVLLVALFFVGFAIRVYCWKALYQPMAGRDGAWIAWYRHIYYPTWCRLDGLLAGVVLAALVQFRPVWWGRVSSYGNILLLSSVAVLTAAYFVVEDQQSYTASVYGFPLVALGYGLLVGGAVSPGSVLYRWQSRVTTFIAAISYSVYLSHKGVVHMIQSLLQINIHSNLMLLVCTLACVAVAWLMYATIEKPLIRLGRHFLSHSRL